LQAPPDGPTRPRSAESRDFNALPTPRRRGPDAAAGGMADLARRPAQDAHKLIHNVRSGPDPVRGGLEGAPRRA